MTALWTKQLSVGNRMIDCAHKELLDIADRIRQLVEAGDVSALPESFALLEECLNDYFLIEERIAQAINFSFARHGLAHQNLLDRVRHIKNDLLADNGTRSDTALKNCSGALVGCLMWHIKEESQPMKIILDSHFYDLKPAAA